MKTSILKGIWLLLCVSVLAFAFIKREFNDIDIAFVYMMIALSFPLGYVLSILVGLIFYSLYEFAQITMAGGFIQNLFLWFLFVTTGYMQWFYLVPKFVKYWRQKSHNKRMQTDPAKLGR